MEYSTSDSILSIATALTTQALSIIRASGKDAINLVASAFSSPDRLIAANGNTTHVGYIMDGNKKIDQVVVSIYREGKSFTGEDCIEITAHGGLYTTLSIYNLLIKKGFRAAERGEFSFRAFINGKINLTQAEAIKLLSSAKTEKAATMALNGLDNAIFRKIEEIKERALRLMAMLDVALEYPEDEVELDESAFKALLEETLREIDHLLIRWQRDALFLEGAKVVIAGRANAGKSSLFNALLNRERAIVSSLAGTTRDYIDENVTFGELSVKLYDTAGFRETKDEIEKVGIEQTKKIIEDSSLLLYLVDGSSEIVDEDIDFLKNCTKNYIVVLTKKDVKKPERALLEKCEEINIKGERLKSVSAKNGEGIKELIDACTSLLVKDGEEPLPEVALISERQKILLEEVEKHLQYIKTQYIDTNNFEYMDMIMQELQNCLNALGQITGEVRADDVLEKVFSSFCVGK